MIHQWPHDREPSRLAFISDLHLFSRRSNADEHRRMIEETVRWCEMCVWGGDLFDFRWSGDRHGRQTVARSLEWLEHWYRRFPETTFVFLTGNHDIHPEFVTALAAWAEGKDRFSNGMDCLRVRDTLLVHGDVIEGDGTAEAFDRYRTRWSNKATANQWQNHAYDVAIAARVHRAVATAAHRKKATCLRLLRWMHRQPSDAIRGVRQIVFGHTHRVIDGLWVDNVRFYNGGAAIRHVPFSPVRLEMHDTGWEPSP